jgi:hypothetical protein
MRRFAFLAILAVVTCMLAGCVTTSAGIASSSRPLAPDGYMVINSTSGTSWGFQLFMGFLPITQASTADALDQALRSRGADALVQVSVDNLSIGFPLPLVNIFSLQRIKVEGLAVKANVSSPIR